MMGPRPRGYTEEPCTQAGGQPGAPPGGQLSKHKGAPLQATRRGAELQQTRRQHAPSTHPLLPVLLVVKHGVVAVVVLLPV